MCGTGNSHNPFTPNHLQWQRLYCCHQHACNYVQLLTSLWSPRWKDRAMSQKCGKRNVFCQLSHSQFCGYFGSVDSCGRDSLYLSQAYQVCLEISKDWIWIHYQWIFYFILSFACYCIIHTIKSATDIYVLLSNFSAEVLSSFPLSSPYHLFQCLRAFQQSLPLFHKI